MQTDISQLIQAKYCRGRFLGKGCAGSVFEVTRVEDGARFALKSCFARDIEDQAIQRAFREASLMKRLLIQASPDTEVCVPWLVRIEDFWVDEVSQTGDNEASGIYVNFVMELVDGIPMDAYVNQLTNPRMKKRKSGGFARIRPGEVLSDEDNEVIEIQPQTIYNWLAQLTLALRYIHTNRIIHRDVKPGNVIISRDLEDLKLLDFSIGRSISDGQTHLDTSAGTLNYMAPEVLRNQSYDHACDLWSLGCVLYELLTLRKAFKIANSNRILQSINSGEMPIVPDDCDAGLSMICNRLLNVDPGKRLTTEALVAHPCMRKYVVRNLLKVEAEWKRELFLNILDLRGIVSSESPNADAHTVERCNCSSSNS
jgi:serine/threonine protein kinase